MIESEIRLIKRSSVLYGNPPSFDVLEEFENTIDKELPNLEFIHNNQSILPLFHKLLVAKLGIPLSKLPKRKKKGNNYFSIQMGPDFSKILPFCSKNNNTYAYFFDIWPIFYKEMENFLSNSSINHVFLSSQYTANYFCNKGFKNVSWIPEGISPQMYKYLPYYERSIDVLELGRKYQNIHNEIVSVLKKNHIKHSFEISPGKTIFPSKNDLVLGLSKSKVSLCFPKNETHPDLAGSISTMTNRYLQSMASKCLIVGSTPHEMKYLFGYDPVVQIDLNNPSEHLLEILNNYESYQDLIEKNYKNVLMNHTWNNRWAKIFEIINIDLINRKK